MERTYKKIEIVGSSESGCRGEGLPVSTACDDKQTVWSEVSTLLPRPLSH